MSDADRLFALIPVKDPVRGKSRLASIISQDERYALNVYLARRTLDTCIACFGRDRTLVVTASNTLAGMAATAGVQVVHEDDRDAGLNAALVAAAERASAAGAEAILVVPTDLAFLSEPALREAAAAIPASPGCLIVPDRRNSGTNLLGLSPMRRDLFAFGDASLQRHARQAAKLGYKVRIHQCAELSLDLDLPEDYIAWRAALRDLEGSVVHPPRHRSDHQMTP